MIRDPKTLRRPVYSGKEPNMKDRLALPLSALLVLTAAGAQATQQGLSAQRNWRSMDICARQAQAAYPDFNAEANAKRDAQLKACLNGSNLPPREPLAQPGPK
jgi:hypothetical protein